MRIKTIIFTIILGITLLSAQYRTKILAPNIRTLISGIENQDLSLPVIELNSEQKIEIRFDEMSHESHSYAYTIIHCNADWTPSDLSNTEYLSGYTTAYIRDSERSVNTHHLYTHYRFNVPNDDISLKISGNYVVLIYEDNQRDKPIAQVCFSAVEPRVRASAKVRANTDSEISGRFQQLDFDINLSGYEVRDPMSEIRVVVRQNNRTDNEISQIKPSFLQGSTLKYQNNKALIFEGGNEYRSFDISSVHVSGRGVDRIRFANNRYEAQLLPDRVARGAYEHAFDVNGRFKINSQDAFNDMHTESDYMLVHFSLPVRQVYFDGQLFLGGEYNFNLMNDFSRMQYNNQTESYQNSVLLKQGGYNYQYWFLPKNGTKATVERTEGSYWQTGNEYQIYVYHRAWGERYDRLIGFFQSESNK
jgi:hypothetical protein